MEKIISIGKQDFVALRENDYFYIDKTKWIEEWWESGDDVTLLTRPRRFGKTLNMRMLESFFSNKYQGRSDLFEGLDIWENEKYRQLQGTYPVIFLTFAAVKADNLQAAKKEINAQIAQIYAENRYLMQGSLLSKNEKKSYQSVTMNMDDTQAVLALNQLCSYLERYYGKKVIILLDEYDTPMQEAYLGGYWEAFTAYLRSLFNATFKTNPYLERAVMTGITRVSKESMFSDLNNLKVVTTTSQEYASCFGFTESEVFAALESFQMSDQMDEVKHWYDGFTFGNYKDIYNPWSITNFLKTKEFQTYWVATSSNALADYLIRTAPAEFKEMMESLVKGEEVIVNFDEQIVFEQLDHDENAVWSLLVASGYLKINCIERRGILKIPWYHLSITNLETMSMFYNMFRGWFHATQSNYNGFIKALLEADIKAMNAYMNEVAVMTFSNFDVGNHPSERTQPERFYHGFVLGLLVELSERYSLQSNRESGYGRYDVMLIPLSKTDDAIIMEFKVHDSMEEKDLEATVQMALRQIEEKEYDSALLAMGIAKERIRHYGFAFEGKRVLIGR